MGRKKAAWDRVAFVVPRARILAMESALASFNAGKTDEIAALQLEIWKERRARDDRETAPFTAEDRALIASVIGAEKLPAPGSEVRRAMLKTALFRARRDEGLRQIAPPEMLAAEHARLATDAAALDPTSPLPEATPPELPGHDEVFIHSWFEGVLSDGFDRRTLVTSRFETKPPSQARGAEKRLRGTVDETTVFAHMPDLAAWCPKDILLARSFDDGRMVVGECGGPLTYMFAGDAIAADLHPPIAEAARKLGPDDALVSFLFHDSDLGGEWHERD